MRKTKCRMIYIILTLSLALCGCQSDPDIEIITSKNDGAFDVNALQSASETHGLDETQEIVVRDVFYSTDGTVEYIMDLSQDLITPDMPVIEVKPHYLSREDAKKVAYALFGDVPFYEAEPLLDPIYSAEEIQEKLTRWTPYTSSQAVEQLYGENTDWIIDVVKGFILDYTELYETANESSTDNPCEWSFKKIPFYQLPRDEAAAVNSSTETDSIQASLKIDQVPYRFIVETRDQADYKANYINAYIYDGISPGFIDERIFNATLCRTDKPDDSQIQTIRQQAEDILRKMELGEWKIDECYLSEVFYGEIPEYFINIRAVPVLNGVAAIRQAQPTELTSDDVYAANYAMTDVQFRFAPNGELLNFVMQSPIDVVQVLNDNVKVLGIMDMIEQAKTTLSYSDYHQYDQQFLIESAKEPLQCSVKICDVMYNLNRIRVPNTEANYYYVPCMTLQGTVEFTGKESGSLYYISDTPIPLVAINAVDGSIINVTNQ